MVDKVCAKTLPVRAECFKFVCCPTQYRLGLSGQKLLFSMSSDVLLEEFEVTAPYLDLNLS